MISQVMIQDLVAPTLATLILWGSYIVCMFKMTNLRGENKEFRMPYKPWEKVGTDADWNERVYRAHRAMENLSEWTNMILPVIWAFALFVQRLPVIGGLAPVATIAVALAFAGLYDQYYKGYVYNAKNRTKWFALRIQLFKALLAVDAVAIAYVVVASF